MRVLPLTLTLLALGTFGGIARSAPQSTGDCANRKASQVDARVVPGGTIRRCGIGIQIFGIGGGIFGPRCPEKKFTYPAHQECMGEEALGSFCEPEGTLPVTVEDCECASATLLGTGLLIPTCSCDSSGTSGTVEDARTSPCRAET